MLVAISVLSVLRLSKSLSPRADSPACIYITIVHKTQLKARQNDRHCFSRGQLTQQIQEDECASSHQLLPRGNMQIHLLPGYGILEGRIPPYHAVHRSIHHSTVGTHSVRMVVGDVS